MSGNDNQFVRLIQRFWHFIDIKFLAEGLVEGNIGLLIFVFFVVGLEDICDPVDLQILNPSEVDPIVKTTKGEI